MGKPNDEGTSTQDGGPFVVAACGPGDRAEQAELFNACFKKRIEAAGLTWRYDANPHGRGSSFVTRNAAGLAVSGYACSPRLMVAGDDELSLASVGQTGDVMTHPDWRKRGLFSDLDRAAMAETAERGWPMVFGLPNRRSAHIFLTLGWERVGTVRPWCFVLKSDRASRTARHREGRLAGLMTPLAARRGRLARRGLESALERFVVVPLDHFPPEVLDLSRAVEARHTAMVRRDADYLNWRFLNSPSGLHRVAGLYERDELAGYVVVQVPPEGAEPGTGAFLVDALARDDATLDACIAAGLAELERHGASFVQATAIDGGPWHATLERAGFQPPKPDNHLIVILYVHDPEHPLVEAARSPEQWYFTDGDRDDETMG